MLQGGIVPFGTHVFISYAHSDNEEDAGAWVTRFHELLMAYLISTLKRTKPVIWRDKRLSDNEVFSNSIIENLTDSAVMVAIVTDNYVASEWCLREAKTFCKEAENSIGLAPNNLLRIFKVIKRPPETQETLPLPMQKIMGTEFYIHIDKNERESNDLNDTPVELGEDMGKVFADKLRLRVNRLAQEIGNTLKAVATSADASAVDQGARAQKPTIYLAECGDDQRDDYAALRSELMQRGYTVVPNGGVLPPIEADCRAEVERLLASSSLSVHLLGTRSGRVPGGEGANSVVEIQNELAVKHARSSSLQRVVSLPAGTFEMAVGERHRQFLADMHTSVKLQGGCELITAGLEAVKTATHAALHRIEHPARPVSEVSAGCSVYVIFDRPDLQASKPLRLALEDFATVLKPAFTGEPAEVREANLQNLAACDAVVIFYGNGSDYWKAAVDGDVLRARALRGGRSFQMVTTLLTGETTDDKEDLIGRSGVVDAREGFSPTLLEPLRQALLEPAGDLCNA